MQRQSETEMEMGLERERAGRQRKADTKMQTETKP